MRDWIGTIRRGLRKPPRVIVKRIATELRAQFERLQAPRRRMLTLETLLSTLEAHDLETLWDDLASRAYPAMVAPIDPSHYEACCPGDFSRILSDARNALEHRVEMLGSGPVELGTDIDWMKDFRTGISWPVAYFSDINFSSPDDPGDVKVPWELSRLQWLVPLGQAYLLTGEERYAQGARAIVEHWIDHNPYAETVNWASTMEVALRIISMTWLFHVFHKAIAWRDNAFRTKLLIALFLHVDFTERHVVSSEVNAGVYTVSAAGLVFGGLFFGRGKSAHRWQAQGWKMCSEEIVRQVYPDGVEFEGSISYHRLAMEFFLLPALYRLSLNLPVEGPYRERLVAMAHYTAAYTKPSGMAPIWGDDGGTRALPLGGADINDHRFMIGLVGGAFRDPEVISLFGGPRTEVFWLMGEAVAGSLPEVPILPDSRAFIEAGFFVMRSPEDHIFIDCGPVGLAGRGGHGHNDCLSFEAVLDGVPLVSDRGTLTYTASYTERNIFRSTASHNTPRVDSEEINRFIDPAWLWTLRYDAVPEVSKWETNAEHALFVGSHRGYQRFPQPVLPERTLLADFTKHALYLEDRFTGEGKHEVGETLQLAPNVEIVEVGNDFALLQAEGKRFRIRWRADAGYLPTVEPSTVSPAYGVAVDAVKLAWVRSASELRTFALCIVPASDPAGAEAGLRERLNHYGMTWAL